MLADLHLENFRSYTNSSFDLSEGVNIIVGPNASGKTNLLEAILMLAKGKSYRAKDNELIKFNKDWARLDTHLINGSTRTVKLNPSEGVSKLFEVDKKQYKRLTINHTLPLVLFEPNHLLMLSGGPERRREYLDDLLEQTITGYGSLRRQYKRALAQRNSLLKQHQNFNHDSMFPWNIRLSELGGQIVRARTNLSQQLNKDVKDLYKELSGTKTKVEIIYKNKWPIESYESQLLKDLDKNLEIDKFRGFTSSGPHREDLDVLFDNHKSQEYASRGENRTTILALKILELGIVEDRLNNTPLLLLDDVFSELDGKRRHTLTDYLARYQTFITTTDADTVVAHFTVNNKIIPVS